MLLAAATERLGDLGRAVVEFDASRLRPWSGLRRTVVVLLVTWVTWVTLGPGPASSATIAVLFVGIMDRQYPPHRTVRLMACGTVAMAATHLVADLLSPWTLPVLGILLLLAFTEGASLGLHRDAPQVLHYSGTVAATALVVPHTPGDALATAGVVLLGGAVQTAAAWAAGVLTHTVREDAAVADQVTALADLLDAIPDLTPESAGHPGGAADLARRLERLTRRLTAVQRTVIASDLALYRMELLCVVLWVADQLRLEARAAAVAVTGPLPIRIPAHRAAHFHGTAAVLRTGATVIRHAGRNDPADLAALLDDTADHPWFPDPHLAPLAADFRAVIVQLDAEPPARVPRPRRPLRVLAADVRAAFRPRAAGFRLGARTACAVLVAMVLAVNFDLTRPSWAGNTVLSVFRPDGGAALPRIIQRVLGNTLGAATVVAVALSTHGSVTALLVTMACAVFAAYAFGLVNYGLFGFTMSTSIVTALSALGSHPAQMALGRWLDTLLGASVALVAALAVPVWRADRLAVAVARVRTNLVTWVGGLSARLADAPDAPTAAVVRLRGAETRDAITDALATLRIARAEPVGGRSVVTAARELDGLRTAAAAAAAVEQALRSGARATPADFTTARLAVELLERPAAHPVPGRAPAPAAPPRPTSVDPATTDPAAMGLSTALAALLRAAGSLS